MTASARILPPIALARPLVRQAMLGCRDRLLDTVTGLEALRDGSGTNPMGCASCGAIGIIDAFDGYWAQIPLVFGKLLSACRPATIGRFIATIWIKAVNRVVKGWTLTHVLQEGHKRFIPPAAHLNPASAVFREVFEFGVLAPALHSNPDAVGRAALPADFVPVLQSPVRISHGHLNSKCPLKSKHHLAKIREWMA